MTTIAVISATVGIVVAAALVISLVTGLVIIQKAINKTHEL